MQKLLWIVVLCSVVGCGSQRNNNGSPTDHVICGANSDCESGSHCGSDSYCSPRNACQSDTECAFGTTCVDGRCSSNFATETQTAPVRNKIDVLFVVDDTTRTCESQQALNDTIDFWSIHIRDSGADVQMAVVSTDVTDLAGGAGRFRRGPGENCRIQFQPELCQEHVSGVIRSAEYALDNEESRQTMVDAMRCLTFVGVSENTGPRSGLEAMRLALSDSGQAGSLLRPGARLAVVFVVDGNDCSDGTIGTTQGPVYAQPAADGNPWACEYQRNIEDACAYNFQSPGVDPIERDGLLKYPWELCVEGDRDVVESLSSSINTACPSGGCVNALTPRKEYYEFLVDLVARKNGHGDEFAAAAGEISVGSVINPDTGLRFDEPDIPSLFCSGGISGYRYDLFARMFPVNGVAKICESWRGIFGAREPVLSQPTTWLCLEKPPAECDPTRGLDACVGPTGGCHPQFEFESQEYYTCSDAIVRVSVDAGAGPIPLTEGPDYRVSYQSTRCVQKTGSPVEIQLHGDYETDITVTIEYAAAP